jgi:hypothetical protein
MTAPGSPQVLDPRWLHQVVLPSNVAHRANGRQLPLSGMPTEIKERRDGLAVISSSPGGRELNYSCDSKVERLVRAGGRPSIPALVYPRCVRSVPRSRWE